MVNYYHGPIFIPCLCKGSLLKAIVAQDGAQIIASSALRKYYRQTDVEDNHELRNDGGKLRLSLTNGNFKKR